MISSIFSAVLGFVTIPAVIATFTGLVIGLAETGKWIGRLDLPLGSYWSGFGLFVGLAIVIGCGFAFWETAAQ